MKLHFGDEVIELPFWMQVVGLCALVASAVLWA